MGRRRHILLVALVAAGLALSTYLVWQHAHFLFSGQTSGLCKLVSNPKFNCAQVENSEFSELASIPTASFGLFYFLFFLAYLVGLRPSDGDAARRGSAALNAVGIAVSIALGLVSALVVKGFCIGCMLVYTVNLLILGALVPWRRFWTYPVLIYKGAFGIIPQVIGLFRSQEISDRSRAKLTFVLLALAAVINFYAIPKYISAERMRVIILSFDSAPKVEIPVHPWNIARGDATAPIQIVKFTDLQCPTCRRVARDLEEILLHYDQAQYQVVYKHFPLDRSCNRLVAAIGPDFDIHPGSCHMALLAQGAGSLGGFWNALDLFYAMKDYTGRAATDAESMKVWFKDITTATGLTEASWLEFSRSAVNQQRILTDVEDGARLGIESTPTIFINGRRAPGTKYRDLETLLEHAATP